jgi:chemosensory pili system protein ChpA (sensor histidine kinase/response regulator)
MSAETEFDLGSLTWVKGELDNAFEAARVALDRLEWRGQQPAQGGRGSPAPGLWRAPDRRSAGCIASRQRNRAAPRGDGGARRPAQSGILRDIVLKAIAALKGYLDELMAGAPHSELRLAPTLHAVMTRRGAEAPAPSELFYPDTGTRAPRQLPPKCRSTMKPAAERCVSRA